MKEDLKKELSSIRQEMKTLILELEDIELGIRNDFQNIGEEACANQLHTVYEALITSYCMNIE
jgi:hypothetical protein